MKYRIALILAIVLTWMSCSTKKNTGLSRTYHNLTSHYNVYFNGRESYKEGMLYIEDNLQDDYSNVLNIFLYDDPTATSVGSQMQRSQKKGSKLIKRHSITAKPKRKKGRKTKKEKAFYERKEYNDWVDDAHLLMGKSFLIERNYKAAEENFTWILSEFPKEETKYDALIWLARTFIQAKNYKKGIDFLQRAEAEQDFPEKRLNKDLYLTYADYYLKQKKYTEAIPWLEMAIKEKGKKANKRRYKYIIAQIYQLQGKDKKAYNMYKEVLEMRPVYDMEFSAKIQRATLFDKKSGDSKGIRKQLQKMLRDEKNIDFKDQIYYALANIDMKENLEPDAIKNFKLSAFTSVSNTAQKGLSYLSLADIYFEKLNYVTAKAYYDSTVMNISKKHPNFEAVSAKSISLTELVGHIETIQLQDSLLALAQLPVGQRTSVINGIIQKIIEEEQRLAEERRQQQIEMAQYNENNRRGSDNSSQGGKWYFYNPAAIGMGQADFARKWGERRFEDNWRRKNKTVDTFEEFGEDGELLAQDSVQVRVDTKSPDYYLSQLPLTDSAQAVTHLTIENALFQLARVYREQFVDYDKSISTYEELLRRYPDTEHQLEAYFQLYQLHELQKQPEKSTQYKQLILEHYANSIPAKILTDPNFLAKEEAAKNKTKDMYANAYKAFKEWKFSKVLKYCEHVEENNPTTPYMAKFKILKAQSIGAKGNVEGMKTELSNIKIDYPETEESELADFMLGHIEAGGFKNFVRQGEDAYVYSGKSKSGNSSSEEGVEGEGDIIEVVAPAMVYTYNENSPHEYVMAATGEISDLNRLKFNIVKYNLDFFLMFDFNVADRKLTSDTKLIVVKPLNNSKEAYKYLKLIRKNSDVYSEFSTLKMQQFIISSPNLKILLKDKDVDRYLMFFQQNYTK